MDNHLLPLLPGTLAPDFTLHQTPWLRLSLRRLTGRPTILVFYPMAFEPVSREQLTLYQEFLPQFDGFDAQLLGISIDHAWCHNAFARATGLRFPLLSDISPRGMVSRLYGVYRELEEVSARALFVIDRSGMIRFSQTYPDLFNPGVDDVLTVLETLRVEENAWQHGGTQVDLNSLHRESTPLSLYPSSRPLLERMTHEQLIQSRHHRWHPDLHRLDLAASLRLLHLVPGRLLRQYLP